MPNIGNQKFHSQEIVLYYIPHSIPMRWSELDDVIASRCIISISGDSPLLEYSGKHEIYAPIIVRKIGDSMILILSMKKNENVDKFTALFPRIFHAEDKGNSWLIKSPLKLFPEVAIIDDLIKIPSVIMQHLYLKNGKLFIDIRFHESRSKEISNFIVEHLTDDGKIVLESLLPRSSAISFLTEMNSMVPITFISYSVPLFNADPIEMMLSEGDSIAEIEKKPGSNYWALVFSKSPINKQDDFITISKENNLYETWGNNPILQEIRNISNDNSIFRLAHFLEVNEGRLIVSTFIPTYQAMEFIRLISNIGFNGEKHLVKLHSFRSYDQDLINASLRDKHPQRERKDNTKMILRNCAVLELHGVHPKFLKIGDMRIGEQDHFHVIGRERGQWFFYRRIMQQLTDGEKKRLLERSSSLKMTFDPYSPSNIIRMSIPDVQGQFYDDINDLPGCRVSPITLQNAGNVYVSIEFHESQSQKVSDLILDFIMKDAPYDRNLVHYGLNPGDLPYLLNLYTSLGNAPSNLALVKTRWVLDKETIASENHGIFQNSGIFIPKQFADDESDKLIWRMDQPGIKVDALHTVIDDFEHLVEMSVKSRFFSDFYANVIRSYCGATFFGIKCEENTLNNYFIVERHALERFLEGLNRHWNLPARRHHYNYLVEVTDLSRYDNLSEFPF